jgi:hypothetical protein
MSPNAEHSNFPNSVLIIGRLYPENWSQPEIGREPWIFAGLVFLREIPYHDYSN